MSKHRQRKLHTANAAVGLPSKRDPEEIWDNVCETGDIARDSLHCCGAFS